MNNGGGYKIYLKNRKAFHDYCVEQTYIAGISLCGSEVKSIKLKKADLTDSYIIITKQMQAFAYNVTIQPYLSSNKILDSFNKNNDPSRPRRLLLNKREIAKIFTLTNKTGKTIVPLSMFYNSRHLVKLEIAVVSPLKKYDKKRKLKEKDILREVKRELNDI